MSLAGMNDTVAVYAWSEWPGPVRDRFQYGRPY
jgi:hypothetical protein